MFLVGVKFRLVRRTVLKLCTNILPGSKRVGRHLVHHHAFQAKKFGKL